MDRGRAPPAARRRDAVEASSTAFLPRDLDMMKGFIHVRLPMHGTAELGKGLEAAIRRQPGLK
jgi:hypothetical protein